MVVQGHAGNIMNGAHVVFRTDASLQIGTGHVMRCLTLADALRQRGAACHFLCREHVGNLTSLIRRRGYEVSVLPVREDGVLSAAPPAHAAWLGVPWEEDADRTQACAGGTAIDWLVVDHYAVDARWEQSLRPHCRHLMVIDDLADRQHDCDVLLDQNLGRDAADYATLVPPDCELLIGPNYALLRTEFAKMRPHSLMRREPSQLRRILVTMGGVDRDNVTGDVLDALRNCLLPPDCRITVVMGSQAPALDSVRQQAATMPWPAEVHVNVTDMAALMAECDVAIGAAGGTSWERCCLGVPTLIAVLAENQQRIAVSLDAGGAAINLGEAKLPNFKLAVADAVDWLMNSSSALSHMSIKARTITQGDGAQKVVDKMTSLSYV